MQHCPNCGQPWPDDMVPVEPPLGSWVKDKHGGAMLHHVDSDGNDGWSPGPNFMALGQWKAMWKARGPFVACGPWGAEL